MSRARPTRLTAFTLALAFALLAGLTASTLATGTTTARLQARFTPERLGARTTLDFGFSFSSTGSLIPPPLTEIALRYPSDLGIALSGLGLNTCDSKTLESSGPNGCPRNSIMGYGEAFTGILLGTNLIEEDAPITILRARNQEGRIALLFYSEGTTPVNSRVVFPGLLLPGSAPSDLVSIGVPLVPTLPGAPYISVIRLRATVGPVGVTYYENLDGTTLAYRPLGILLPKRCPRHGFQFGARFQFLDGTHTVAHTTVLCPRGRH